MVDKTAKSKTKFMIDAPYGKLLALTARTNGETDEDMWFHGTRSKIRRIDPMYITVMSPVVHLILAAMVFFGFLVSAAARPITPVPA
jgi:hypothetical protein